MVILTFIFAIKGINYSSSHVCLYIFWWSKYIYIILYIYLNKIQIYNISYGTSTIHVSLNIYNRPMDPELLGVDLDQTLQSKPLKANKSLPPNKLNGWVVEKKNFLHSLPRNGVEFQCVAKWCCRCCMIFSYVWLELLNLHLDWFKASVSNDSGLTFCL